MDTGTLIALGALLVSVFGAAVKYIDRRRQLAREQKERNKNEAVTEIERDSIVVRGAEGALLLMEKTLKTSSDECEKRINELEEENESLKCELTEVRTELKEHRAEARNEIAELKAQIQELTRRVNNG